MLYRSLFPRKLFVDFEQLQCELQSVWDGAPAVRGPGRSGYPALNVGTTADAVEVFVFAPGMDPKGFDVQIERDVLTISGERLAEAQSKDDKTTLHLNERFADRFKRVVRLPDDVDAGQVKAEYRDGVLHLRLARRQAQEARRITIQ